jgi:hypothetical protein
MNKQEATGVDYPTIDLGGKEYAVKYTKAAAYELSVAGVDLSSVARGGRNIVPFHQIVNAVQILTGYPGTPMELAEVLFDRQQEALNKITVAASKILPAIKVKLQEPSAQDQQPSDPSPVQ